MKEADSAAAYCQALVRTHDPDRFLVSLFYPPELRPDLWALYAFNYEIARTREVVTDTHIGLIRLQWWRDALEKFYETGEVVKHEGMAGLARAIQNHHLPREMLEHLIYAHEFDLEDRPPGSLEGLCNYADFTHTPLLRLGVMVAGENHQHSSLRPVATAYALAGIMRAVPFHRAQGRSLLPEDLMRKEGIDAGTLVPVIRAIREEAEKILSREKSSDEPRMVRLHRVIAKEYLNKIRRLRDNSDDPRMSVAPLLRGIGLWRAGKKK